MTAKNVVAVGKNQSNLTRKSSSRSETINSASVDGSFHHAHRSCGIENFSKSKQKLDKTNKMHGRIYGFFLNVERNRLRNDG